MSNSEGVTCTLAPADFAVVMQAVLQKGKTFRFRARGASMTPFIRDGDTLTVAPLLRGKPRRGEAVVVFRPSEIQPSLVVHRVVELHEGGFAIQGDAAGCEPEIIPREAIVGRVVRVERGGNDIRLGLGPERLLLAWMIRTRILWTVIWPLWNLVGRVFGRRARTRTNDVDSHAKD